MTIILITEANVKDGFAYLDKLKLEGKTKIWEMVDRLVTDLEYDRPKAQLVFKEWNRTLAEDIKTFDGRVRSTVRRLQDTDGWKAAMFNDVGKGGS